MKHDFLDRYADIDSPVHRLDPRVKTFSLFLFVFVVVSAPLSPLFIAYFIPLFSLTLLARLPLIHIFKRSLVVVPFVLLVTVFSLTLPEGPKIFANVLAKSWLSVLSMTLLTSTTRFPDFLKALEYFHIPSIFTNILAFMYRYLFLFAGELERMHRAAASRNLQGSFRRRLRIAGNLIGALFIRAYERGERVYIAMLSRGYKHDFHTPHEFRMNSADALFLVMFSFILLLLRFGQ